MMLLTSSAAETQALGRRLGTLLRAGDVVGLSGDLGAGKTVFTRGIAEGAGASGYVASPTFTFVREYKGSTLVYHVDLYRLDDPRQLDDLGLDEILDRDAIVVIEWAEKAASLLPGEHLWVTISFIDDEDRRFIHFLPKGERYEEMTRALVAMT